jgi:hypothetical protein
MENSFFCPEQFWGYSILFSRRPLTQFLKAKYAHGWNGQKYPDEWREPHQIKNLKIDDKGLTIFSSDRALSCLPDNASVKY